MSQAGQYFLGPSLLEVKSLTGNVGGAVGPDGAGNVDVLGDGTVVIVTGTPASNLLTIAVASATTTNEGVAELATNAETITGTDSNRIVVPSSLAAKLGSQTQYAVPYGDGSTNALQWTSAATDGQLVIGATGAAPAFAALTSTGSTLAYTAGANSLNIDLTADVQETAIHGWNGYLLETVDIAVTSDGATITAAAEQAGGGDLTVIFSDGFHDWDTTPADTIALTAGSDTSPQINFVYFLQSTKLLTVSTSNWPATEHAPLATVLCQSAASVQTDGVYKLHTWTDHVVDTNQQGHISDISFWIRGQAATWQSGVAQTLTITPNGGAPDNVIFTSASGIVLQLHDHTFPAFSGTPDVYTVNDSATPFNIVTDLNVLLTDSTGASMSGKYFSLVIWGVASEDGATNSKLMVNLPGGSYNTQSNLISDPLQFADFSIPTDFRGTGFLIAELQLRHQAAASGTWTEIDLVDLRGQFPQSGAGGATVGQTEFIDNTFRILDEGDSTKEIAFQASGITTATTRTLTVQDADGTIALSGVANFGTGVTSMTDHGVLLGSGTSPITVTTAATDGQAFLGATGADPAFGTITSSGGSITFTLGANSLNMEAAGGGIMWNEETGTSVTMAVDNGYIANNAALVTLTLPDTAALGSAIKIVGKGAGGWLIAQNAGESIRWDEATVTTTGVGGSLASTDDHDFIEILCTTADTVWTVLSVKGNITVV